jgi:hypothetical protein
MTTSVSAEELQAFLDREFPQYTVVVDRVTSEEIWVRQPLDEAHLLPVGTLSGATMMATAACAAYVAVLAHIAIVPLCDQQPQYQLSAQSCSEPAYPRQGHDAPSGSAFGTFGSGIIIRW